VSNKIMTSIKEKPYVFFFGLFFILSILPHFLLIDQSTTISMGVASLVSLGFGLHMRQKMHPISLPKKHRLTISVLQIILVVILSFLLFWLMT